jgi:hypothetical protein
MLTAAQKRQAVKAAERGALLFDKYITNWQNRISVDDLEMSDGSQCMLGQTFGDFESGLRVIAGIAINKVMKGAGIELVNNGYEAQIDGAHYGFNSPDDIGGGTAENQYFSILGETWQQAIAYRKQRAARSRIAKKAAATRRARANASVIVAKAGTRGGGK